MGSKGFSGFSSRPELPGLFSVKHWTTTPPKSTHHGVGGAILKALRGLEATCFGHFVSNKDSGKITFLAYRVHIM